MGTLDFDLEAVQALYDENRFLDAYALSRSAWDHPERVPELGVEALVLGGRLAGRLGSEKVQRWLFRRAWEVDPRSPLVRYFARGGMGLGWNLLEDLRSYEAEPELGSGDPELEAGWLAHQARAWALARDFERAEGLLERASGLGAEPVWVGYCRAEVLFAEDRVAEALAVAESAWERARGLPALAHMLGKALSRLGRVEEAAERLRAAAEAGQSVEVLLMALWHLCAAAERRPAPEQRALAEEAYALSGLLAERAVLADRAMRSLMAQARMDCAMVLGDVEAVRRHAAEVRSPFFQSVFERLRFDPGGRRTLLPFRPVRQNHQTCLPSSIAAVAGTFGVHIDDDALARALTYGGTATWRAVDWLREQGLAVRLFVTTPTLSRRLLEAGVPFVYMIEAINWAHAAAAVGMDEVMGLLIIHDPSQTRWGRVLIDRMAEEEAPFGPEAIAIVPADRAELLELIPDSASEPYTALVDYQRCWEQNGPRAGEPVVASLEARYPDSPFALRLRALHCGLSGDLYTAIQRQEALLAQYPECVLLRRELLDSLHRTRDTARVLKVLEDVVKRKLHPGIRENQRWRYPPATYVARYADYLGMTAGHFREAERLLGKTIGREPHEGEAFHVLGDVLARQERHGESVLPYRVAACLDEENDHYARATCDAMRLVGREAEGLAFLEGRVGRLGTKIHGGMAWLTWIRALADYGRPAEAASAMERAQVEQPDSAPLQAFATRFWLGMGRWEAASAALAAVERTGHRGLFLEAATEFYRRQGDWWQALTMAEEWCREAPDQLTARGAWLHLLARRDGRGAALSEAERLMREHEGHEEFEELYYEELRRLFKREEQEALIRRRVKRNPLDGWAWRELGHLLMDRAEGLGKEARRPVLAEVSEVVARSEALSPQDAATWFLKARLSAQGNTMNQAVDQLFQALSIAPDFWACYDRLWTCVETLPLDRQRRVLERMEEPLFRAVDHLHGARGIAFRAAERFGVREAEALVERWMGRRPGDPELIEAMADLLLEYGHGRADAERVVALLTPAVERFPHHFDLRFSLASAYGVLLLEEDQIAALREIIRRDPTNSAARRNLAAVLIRRGDAEEALAVMAAATEADPLDAEAWAMRARVVWELGDHDGAVAVLGEAVERMPESIGLRETLIDRLHETGNHGQAVAVARAGVEQFPNGAYCYQLLAQALANSEAHTDVAEVERLLRKALELNSELYESADQLAVVLATQRRFDEAKELVRNQVPLLNDPCQARGRLAWLTRQEGLGGQAVRDMVKVLRKWPLYHWGWWQLLGWLEEDADWERAEQLLGEVPAPLLDDPAFCARRLEILQAAGVGRETLDREWQRLLENFPEEAPLHTRRFDLLWDAGEHAEAAAVLDGIARFHGQSSYVLARQVQVLAERGARPEAVETALRLWQLPGEGEVWPEETAWRALEEAGYRSDAVERGLGVIDAGGRLRRAAFALLTKHIAGLSPDSSLLEKLDVRKAVGRSAPVARLLGLLGRLDALDGDVAHYKAIVLRRLEEFGGAEAALEYWRDHRERCRRETAVWQQVGSILVSGSPDQRLALREWMADWREREDVEMWAVANYSLALHRVEGRPAAGEDLEEMLATSRDVLERLEHDRLACYHVCVLGEAALRLGRDESFLAAMERWAGVLEGWEGEFWLPQDYEAVPDVLLLFVELGRAQSPDAVRALTAALLAIRPRRLRWIDSEWRARTRGQEGLWQWLRLRLGL